MRPHPRTRKTIKWVGAAATVLLLATWTASGWYGVGFFPSRLPCIGIATGRLMIIPHASTVIVQPQNPILHVGIFHIWSNDSPATGLTYQWHLSIRNSPRIGMWYIPLWLPTLPLLLTTAAAWRLDTLARRRLRAGHCPTCNYDLTGLPTTPTAPCPECGATRASPAPAHS